MQRTLLSAAAAAALILSASACASVAAATAPAPVPAATAAPVVVRASGPTTVRFTFETGAQTGHIMVALYNAEAAYTGGAAVKAVRVDVAAGQHEAVFADLPAGDYAMKAFHDVDGNGQMNTNPFGIPSEPFAFSNNARGMMGPASWDRAHFTVAADVAQTISIR